LKIQILSDLHVEFAPFDYPHGDCDVVVLAGDIHTKDRGVKWALDNIKDKPVIYVLGNHEFYGKTYPKLIGELKTVAKGSNVHVLENEVITLEGVNFFGCTLWTDFEIFRDPQIAGYHCQQMMTDYKKIKKLPGYSKIRSLDTAIYHRHSVDWLGKALASHRGEVNVVVTHHAPSKQSAPEHYWEDLTLAAYVSDMEAFIATHQPTMWIHGHLHKCADYTVGGTRILCNPKGYPGEQHTGFDPYKIVRIGK
jgi:Icc-related predicted phosphoesterase